jgi:type II restriction/modification system DNA methylase subunit YeeA
LEEIGEPENLQKLRWLFTDPERLRPGQTRDAVTETVAKAFASIAQRLRDNGHAPQDVAHFVNRLLFCMFAEDIELLPDRLFTRMLETCEHAPERFAPMASELFSKMNTGGYFGADEIAWFNGGLFDDADALPLDAEGVKQTLIAARMDWSSIEPSIFGTMFERGLDPAKRSQLGAHYTDAGKIMLIIEPVILKPLRQEWDEAKVQIETTLKKVNAAKSKGARNKGMQKAQSLLGAYLDRLRNVRVLDPACGSGNFLYLALMHLKDLEHRVLLEAESMGLGMQMPQLGPEVVKGIEINAYAAELARVTVWIGQIQWMTQHGFSANRKPVLKSLDTIENRDALIVIPQGSFSAASGIHLLPESLNRESIEPKSKAFTTENAEESQNRTANEQKVNGAAREAPLGDELTRIKEAEWPDADFIIGNPPFLGGSKMRGELGDEYTSTVRKLYKGRVPGGADLVTYWFAKAGEHINNGKTLRAGFVSTQAIRGGANRKVLERIIEHSPIFEAWSDEPWIVDGAAVRVSLVGFGKGSDNFLLDGRTVPQINADLTTGGMNLSDVRPLNRNQGISFEGIRKDGPLDIQGTLAREWLNLPSNPNGRMNSDVLKPLMNAMDITRRPRDIWIIDFGTEMSAADAALFETPFEYVVEHVKPLRDTNRDKIRRTFWWRTGRSGADLRAALEPLSRYIVTPRVAKHRVFIWLDKSIIPDTRLNSIACEGDATFGVLHSRIHEVWSLATCSWHGVGNDPTYNAKSCFETFPFPPGFSFVPSCLCGEPWDAIAEAAKRLDELRNNWLNPPEWVERIPEVVEGFPDRIIAKLDHESDLKKRTLTNLYNVRPAWLDNIHKELDAAVATAYGWDDYTPDMPDEEILARLFKLNQERSIK